MKFHVLSLLSLFIAACASSGLGPVVPKSPVQRQMIGLLQKFDRWDDNGDSLLDKSELTNGLGSLHGKPQQVNYSTDEVIAFYDTDHDGKISMMEAQAGYQRSAEAETRLKH